MEMQLILMRLASNNMLIFISVIHVNGSNVLMKYASKFFLHFVQEFH